MRIAYEAKYRGPGEGASQDESCDGRNAQATQYRHHHDRGAQDDDEFLEVVDFRHALDLLKQRAGEYQLQD